jgi:hypothetical protein
VSGRAGDSLVAGCLRPWAEQLCGLVGARPGDRALDVLSDGAVMAHLLQRHVAPGGSVVTVDDEGEAAVLAPAAADVVTSLFGLAHAADPFARLAAMQAALRPAGRLAAAVWAGRAGASHEAAVLAGLEHAGLGSEFIRQALRLGEPGVLEAGLRERGLSDALQLRRLRDVVRFDGVDHLLAALLDERPVAAEVGALPSGTRQRVRSLCAARLEPFTAADGTLRIPVTAVVVTAGVDGRVSR